KYMKAREYIRTRICTIKSPHHIHKNIIPLKDNRPQILSIRENSTYDKKYGHPRKHKFSQPVKSRHICKEKIQKRRDDKYKPHQIRNNKIFDERNMLIQPDLDHMVMRSHMFLKKHKPWHVDKDI